ncbi:MAG TPA: FecR domain-containing protein, partial [Membranihabitans sp.]|nr:FecR domain-containing protein [Membranihabitans sp.]
TSKPFQVVADEITTTVLGTSFSINTDPDNIKVEVMVTSGRVRVASKNKELAILEKDDQLAYEAGEYTVTRMDQNHGNKVDQLPVPGNWKLANVTMAEAMSFVGKRWGKSFTFDNPNIKDCPLYASFNAEDTLEEVLMVLCGVSNSEYKLDNEKITIYGNGCH